MCIWDINQLEILCGYRKYDLFLNMSGPGLFESSIIWAFLTKDNLTLWGVEGGIITCMTYLKDKNSKIGGSRTPLLEAATNGHFKICQMLHWWSKNAT